MVTSLRLAVLLAALLLASCSGSKVTLMEASIADIQAGIRAGEVTCEDVVARYLERIEAYDKSSGLNAITVTNPAALDRARETDAAIARGKSQPDLFCTPILVKDNFDTHDLVTSGGSMALLDDLPPDDAFVVAKLREAGAIVIAKTNMGEWAFSPRETVSSSFGRTANAYDLNHTPAGSSGGTAAGIAANFAVAGLGSDTGNSIRGPSSHLALFGIRPTIGLVSRDGVIPLLFDRDVVGPMTRTVADGVRLFNVMAGHDPADSLSVPDRREPDYNVFVEPGRLDGRRIGILRALVDHEDADPEILRLFEAAIQDLAELGAVIVDEVTIADFAELDAGIDSCGSFRYDLYRYLETRASPPFLDVNKVLERGDFSPPARGGLEYFSKFPLTTAPEQREDPCKTWPHHEARNQLRANTIAAMDEARVDALVYPTWSNPPALIDRAFEDYRGDNSQRLVPDAGLPAVTVPMGFWQDRLPVGLQVTGRPFDEGTLIRIAYRYEQATRHRRPPPVFE